MRFFGRANRSDRDQASPPPLPPEVDSHEFSLKLSYSAKSSDGVRLKADPGLSQRLHSMLAGYVQGESELVEPLPASLGQASPDIARLPGSAQWLQYHRDRSPVTRHALVVLESVDAIDLVYESIVCGLLSGETDTMGYPEYNAIVGGVVSHFDEVTGDPIVRAVVGWGGKGVRGDTDRNAAGILAGLFNNVAGDSLAVGTVAVDRPMPSSGTGGLACPHCGFDSGHERAFYCPKCGMRMLRV
ncbi:MAG TPA: hypothetical protein VGE81_10085 [Candidatus Limnocylindrales bacterium]